MDHINSYILAFVKRLYYRYGGTQLADVVMSAILDLLDSLLSIWNKNADPDSVEQIVLNRLKMTLSAAKRIISGGGGKSQSQSKNGQFSYLLGTHGSALPSPKDEVAQKILPLLNMLVSGTENTMGGGGQEVHVAIGQLPIYIDKQFDRRMSLESVGKNAAMAESDNVGLSEEAKTQLWGAILGSLASGVPNRHLSG